MADVDAERPIAGRVRPDEHAVGISFVLRNVVLQPLDH